MFNAYQTDLPRKVHFVDEVERWKIRWALVDDNPETLLDTLHEANRDLHSIISIQGRIQDFKLGGGGGGGGALKKIAPSGGRCEKFLGYVV